MTKHSEKQKENNNMNENTNTETLEKTESEQATSENISEEVKQAAAEAVVENITPEKSSDEIITELNDKNLRLLAEMQNLRSRTAKDLDDARKYAITSFAQDLILVLDNLERAKANIPQDKLTDEAFKNVFEGVEMTFNELLKTLAQHGIERIEPKAGDKFDYKIHQALVQIPTAEFEEGAIVNIVSPGYIIKDRILRPAMVAVAKKLEA
jgi:molecular chaperone GrpE